MTLGYHRILTELMYKRRDLRVEDECFGGDAAVPDTADIGAIDDSC